MYQALGGAEGVRALTDRFYDVMDSRPEYAALRSIHSGDMAGIRQKLYEFFSGWLGGPPLFEQKHGHPRLKMRHMPFAVTAALRDEWVACFAQAMHDCSIEKRLAEPLLLQLYAMADWMRNQDEAEHEPPLPPGASNPEARLAALTALLPRYGVAGYFQTA